jgi:O-antigen/teichoic acid export membrane protein
VTTIDTHPHSLPVADERDEPAPPWNRQLFSLAKARPSSDVLWLIGGQVLLAVGQLAGIRLLTETVRPEIFGTVSIMLGLVVLGRSQFSLPFAMAAMRQYAEAAQRDDVGMLRRVVSYWLRRTLGLAAVLVLLVGVPYCLFRSISLWLPALTLGLLVVDTEVMIEASFLNASKQHRIYSLLRGAEAWIRPLLAVGLVILLGPSAVLVLVGYLVGGLILVVAIRLLRGRHRRATSGLIDPLLTRRVWRFCLPLLPIAPVEWVSSLSDRYVIGGLIGLDAAGIYAASYGLISQPFLMAGIVLENYFRPHYYDALLEKGSASARRILRKWFALTAAVCGLGLIGVIALKSWIVALFLAESYRTAAGLLFPIALGNAFFALSQVSERFLYGHDRTDLCLVTRTIGAGVSLAAGIPMIYCFGLQGAAWAVPLYYGCQLASSLLIVRQIQSQADERTHLVNEDAS